MFQVSMKQIVGVKNPRPVIGIISVDNYDDLEDVISDSDISNIIAFIANFVEEFTAYYHMSTDVGYRFLFVYRLHGLRTVDGIKIFLVIDQFREEAKIVSYLLPFGHGDLRNGDGEHDEIGKVALNQNLGGSSWWGSCQVKMMNRKTLFSFGGGTASAEADRPAHALMMTAISIKIKSADQVFIVA